MNTDFNYYGFLKKKDFKYDIKINLSGLDLKGDASITEIDPYSGDVTEVNLNEIVDENINYVYNLGDSVVATYISTDLNSSNELISNVESRFDGQDVIETDLIDFNESSNPVTITLGSNDTVIPIKPRHELMMDSEYFEDNVILSASNSRLDDSLSNINVLTITASTILQGLNTPFRNEVTYQEKVINSTDNGFIGYDRVFITIEGSDIKSLNNEFEVSSVNVRDQHIFNIRVNFNETLSGNIGRITKTRISYGGYIKRSVIVDREVYAALGLWDTNKLNIDNDMGVIDSRAHGFINKKTFYRALNQLSSRVNPLGIEVLTTEYMGNENDDGVDDNISFLPRNRNFNFNFTKQAATQFVKSKNIKDELLPVDTSNINPFTMSVKDAFVAQFASSEELRSELLSGVVGLIDAITDNILVSSSIDLSNFIGDDANTNPIPIIIRTPVGPFSYEDAIDYLADNNIPIKVISGAYGTERDDEQPKPPRFELSYSPIEDLGYFIDINGNTVVDPNDPNTLVYNLYTIYETYIDSVNDGIVRFTYVNGNPDTAVKIIKQNMEFNDNSTKVFDRIIEFIEYIDSMMGSIRSLASLSAVTGGVASRLLLISIANIERKYNEIEDTLKRIRWYQKYTNQSVLNTGEFIHESRKSHLTYKYNKQLARLLVPVDFGTKKVKRKIRNIFGVPITVYRRVDMGIRWVEVSFIDTSTFKKYRKNNNTTGKIFTINTPFTSLIVTEGNVVRGILSNPLSNDIINRNIEIVNINIISGDNNTMNGNFVARIVDESTIEYRINGITNGYINNGAVLSTLTISLAPTQDNTEPDKIRVTYNMPHLPFDDELRDKIFNDFGPFDQSVYSNKRRGGDYTLTDIGSINISDDIPGWEIFKESSKEIRHMREGLDIYNKVEFLVKILHDEFGKSRVNIIETTRSFQDQEYLQLGGTVSSFLSWHNYGLAVKITINEKDGITTIKDGSADFMRLLDIAEGFCEGAKQGAFGKPMNVVWCGQLVTGSDIFVWEFLPIGVNHKDIIKFRDSIYQQKDPLVDNSFVNVTSEKYIIQVGSIPPLDGTPYIIDASKGVREGKIINNEVWVHPKYINNYIIPNDLILKDIQEFLLLVKAKMNANGTELTGRKKISEWKAKNPRSFKQLVSFYGLTGALSTTRKLLSVDYIEKFQNMVNTLADNDPVSFVRRYLGDIEYNNVKIYLEDLSDSSYININDGTLTTPVLEARSIHPEGSGNTFGQKQVDYGSVEFGQFQDGVFVHETDDRIINIKTSRSVINGYINGIPVESDALLLHTLIANQIVDEFNDIKDAFNNLSIKFMHDKFFEGSNNNLVNLIENEFGVIKTQDIMTFDDLRQMYDRIAINNRKTDGDGGVRGAGANIEAQNENADIGLEVDRNKIHSVFEKLISNSQLTGIKRASLTKEKPVIEQLANGVKVEDVIEAIQNRRIPRVRDIL